MTLESLAEAEVADDESILERRLRFLSMRNAGGTLAAIAERWNAAQRQIVDRAGGDPSTAKRVSVTTVRKDIEAAKQTLVTESTREGLIAQEYSVILDVRRAAYSAAMGGDVDALKIVQGTGRDVRELFGLDQPKRMSVGVGTDVEFAESLLSLVEQIGADAQRELAQVARQENDFIEGEVITSRDETDPPESAEVIPAESWSNLSD